MRRRITLAVAVVATVLGVYSLVVSRRIESHSVADASPVASGSTRAAATSPAAATSSATPSARASEAKEQAEQLDSAASSAAARSAAVVAAQANVAALTAGLSAGAYSIAATNLTTGATYSAGATGGMWTASVVKLDILETLLLQHQQSGTPLSSDEDADAVAMIENSDNDAAEDLWEDVGSDQAVTLANQSLGVTNTQPGTDDYWGLTTTFAGDQVALLKNLVTAGPLDAASKAYALGLMENVESDQRWGVGVVADAGTTFANKNGWLAVSNDDDLWTVNSDGIVTVGGQQVLISVMTRYDSDFDSGVDLVQSLAKAIVPIVVPA